MNESTPAAPSSVIGKRYPVEKYRRHGYMNVDVEVAEIGFPSVVEPWDKEARKYGPPEVIVPAVAFVVKKDGEAGLVKERLHLPFADLTEHDRGTLAEQLITKAKLLEETAAKHRRHAEWLMNNLSHFFLGEWKDERRAYLDRLDAAQEEHRARRGR